MKTIDLVVPCYNEEAGLEHFVLETNKVINSLPEYSFRYILVNDGSKDRTYLIMKKLAKTFNNIKYISFSRNFGKEAAMYAGLKHTTADYVVVMDADLQHPPQLFPQMIQAVEHEGYDCCATKRAEREGESKFRGIFSKLFFKLSNRLTDVKMPYGAMDFRMMSRQMVDSILELSEVQRFSKGIFSWVGFNTKWIAYKTVDRQLGQTTWKFSSLFKYAIEGSHKLFGCTAQIHGCYGIYHLRNFAHIHYNNADSNAFSRNYHTRLCHHAVRNPLYGRNHRNVNRYSWRIHRKNLYGSQGQTYLHYKIL